jgi:hypothetical protein
MSGTEEGSDIEEGTEDILFRSSFAGTILIFSP